MATGTKESGDTMLTVVTRVPPPMFKQINQLAQNYNLSYAAMIRAILARGLQTYK